ncbi:MAG TPA: hypothetical protein VGR35_05325 [Tepidisphaeraceae bacterium]|nr:hypothetical protein [Tepidisphaeraceae bacterium]
MTHATRNELFRILAELSEVQPEVRLGQLITNLSYLARGLSTEAVWDVDDAELLAAARRQLEQWRAKHAAGV